MVVGVDHQSEVFRRAGFVVGTSVPDLGAKAPTTNKNPMGAKAEQLPFANNVFDLVFCQLALMWMPLEQATAELGRVTMKGGVVVAIEPDYGGMLEWPEGAGLKEVWIAALDRAGADPFVGRKLPGTLARAGFEVRVETTSGIQPPRAGRFGLLRGLPLTPDEQRKVAEVEKRSGAGFSKWEALVHLPFVLVIGTK